MQHRTVVSFLWVVGAGEDEGYSFAADIIWQFNPMEVSVEQSRRIPLTVSSPAYILLFFTLYDKNSFDELFQNSEPPIKKKTSFPLTPQPRDIKKKL